MFRYWILGYLLFAGHGWSKGLSPYLPLSISPEIETQIERVMALTPGAPLTKPYKAVDVMARNQMLALRFPELHRAVDAYLARYKNSINTTHFSASVATNNAHHSALPNQRQIKRNSSYQISNGLVAYISPYAYIAAGAVWADGENLTHFNTHVAFGYEYAQVEAGYREHWFSPMQDSALLTSTNTKPSPSVTVSNATPISDWDFRYELFYSKLSEITEISEQGQLYRGKPNMAGLHLSISPVDTWTIGVSRTLQLGGASQSISILDALQTIIDPTSEDPSPLLFAQAKARDQKSSISSKLNLPFVFPVSVYGEVAFEDASEMTGAADKATAFGLYFPMVTKDVSLRYEYSSWNELFYQSPFYSQSPANDGQGMGHWASDLFTLPELSKKTSHALNVNWKLASDQVIDVTFRTADNDISSSQGPKAYSELNIRYSFATQYGFWGLELNAGEEREGTQFKRLTAFYRW